MAYDQQLIDFVTYANNTTISAILGKKNDTVRNMVIAATAFLPIDSKIRYRLYCIEHNLYTEKLCPVCSTVLKWRSDVNKLRTYCSHKCVCVSESVQLKKRHTNLIKYGCEYATQATEVKDKIKQTNLDRHGYTSVLKAPTVQDKIKQTMINKYGYDHNWKVPDIRYKIKQTNINRYGYEQPLLVPCIRDKINQTNIDNYGHAYLFNSPDIQTKIKQTNLERYGFESVLSSDIVKTKIKNVNLERYGVIHGAQAHILPSSITKLNDIAWLTEQHHVNTRTLQDISYELSVDLTTVCNYFRKHGVDIRYFKQSQPERELLECIHSIAPLLEIHTNARNIIPPKELDIYIPEKQIAIEYCGVYWHSDKFRDKHYHQQKQLDCADKGIRLLTVFEDEWQFNKTLVINKILSILNIAYTQKIYARKCTIRCISSVEKRSFYDQYHIQGSGPGSITYGLDYNNELVACITFIVKQNGMYELNRYATKYNVVGGFSKLLKHFIRNNPDFNEIISFADLRWSTGNLYTLTGFEHIATTPPIYEYVIGGKRTHRSNFRRANLAKQLGDNFDPTCTEFQNMDNAGIPRIWNCGLLKYRLENK